MATALGIETVFGTGVETTYGTGVTPDRWFEFTRETLDYQKTVVQSNGIRPGGASQAARGSRRSKTKEWAGGPVTMELAKKGMGRWFQQMLGGTPTIVQQGVTAAYLQTHTMGPLSGKSLTIQKIIRDDTGTVISPFTLRGCKVVSWELSCAVDEIATLNCDIDVRQMVTDVAPAAHSYGTSGVFNFSEGALTLDGAIIANVSSASISGNNNLRTDAFFLGTNGLKGEPHFNDRRAVTGTLNAEYQSQATFYDRYTSDAATALVLKFTGGVIATGYNEQITVTIPDVRFTSGTPTVDGFGVILTDADFEAQYDGTNPTIKIEYMSTDTAI